MGKLYSHQDLSKTGILNITVNICHNTKGLANAMM